MRISPLSPKSSSKGSLGRRRHPNLTSSNPLRRRTPKLDAAFVKEAREAIGITQAELGEVIGVKQPAISHLETARLKLRPLVRRELQRMLVDAGRTDVLERYA